METCMFGTAQPNSSSGSIQSLCCWWENQSSRGKNRGVRRKIQISEGLVRCSILTCSQTQTVFWSSSLWAKCLSEFFATLIWKFQQSLVSHFYLKPCGTRACTVVSVLFKVKLHSYVLPQSSINTSLWIVCWGYKERAVEMFSLCPSDL